MITNPRPALRALRNRQLLTVRRWKQRAELRAAARSPASYPSVAGSQLRLLQPIQLNDGADRPLLLYLPGMDGTGQAILQQIPSLLEAGLDVRCLYIPPEDRCTWDQLVAQTCHLLSEALASSVAGSDRSGDGANGPPKRRAVVVGESFGGCLALRLAVQAPELVEKLVLINPATSFNNSLGGLPALISSTNLLALFPDQLYAVAQGVMLPLLVDSDRAGMIGAESMKSMITMTPPPEMYSNGTTKPPPQARMQSVFSAAAQAANWRSNLLRDPGLSEAALASITTPTLVVVGARDRLFPSITEGARLQRVMPKAKRIILPDSAHALLLESSVDFAAILAGAGFLPEAPAAARVPRSKARELLKPLLERSAQMRNGKGYGNAAGGLRNSQPAAVKNIPEPPAQTARGGPAGPGPGSSRSPPAVSMEKPGTVLTFTSLRETARALVEGTGVPAIISGSGAAGSEQAANPSGITAAAQGVTVPGNSVLEAAADSGLTAGVLAEQLADTGRAAQAAAGQGSGVAVLGPSAPHGVEETAERMAAVSATPASGNGGSITMPQSQPGLASAIEPHAGPAGAQSNRTAAQEATATSSEAKTASAADPVNPSDVGSKWDEWSQILVPWRELISPVVRGVENLPDPSTFAAGRPVLFVGNHGKFGMYDTPLLMLELYLRGFQVKGLAHPGHWLGPMGSFFEQFGAVKASPLAAYRLLKGGQHVLLFPGGAREVYKRRGEEYQLFWKETPDFVRLAAKTQAIIVPFAAVGADDAYDVAMDPDEVMQHPVLGPLVSGALKQYSDTMELRDAVPPMPLLPGTRLPSLLPLPNLQRIYFKFLPPVDTAVAASAVGVGRRRRGVASDDAAAEALYSEVRHAVEAGLQDLLELRRGDEETQVGARLQKAASRWFPAVSMTQRLM